jgi:hypothetical protein
MKKERNKIGKEGCGKRYFCRKCKFKTNDYYEWMTHKCDGKESDDNTK